MPLFWFCWALIFLAVCWIGLDKQSTLSTEDDDDDDDAVDRQRQTDCLLPWAPTYPSTVSGLDVVIQAFRSHILALLALVLVPLLLLVLVLVLVPLPLLLPRPSAFKNSASSYHLNPLFPPTTR